MATNNGKKGFTLDETATKLLLVVGGLVVAFLAYQFGFRTFQAKASELDAQSLVLAEEISSLMVIQQDVDDYALRTSTMKKEIDEMLGDINVNIMSPDLVMFAVKMGKSDDIVVTDVKPASEELVYTMNANGTNPTDAGKALYDVNIVLTTQTTYSGLKEALQALLDNPDKVSIAEANFAADDTNGGITGSITLNMYYLVGSDRAYQPFDISGVATGNDKVFGEAAEHMSVQDMYEPDVEDISNEAAGAALESGE